MNKNKYLPWHSLDITTVAKTLATDLKRGLLHDEAARRLRFIGHNNLTEERKIASWQLFVAQFRNFMVMILLGGTAVSFLLGEVADAVAILTIVFINALLGFIQEFRAEKALVALKQLSSPEATVIRNGSETRVPALDLVPGDLVILETGDRIPADIRLIQAVSMEVDESILTGESCPVLKDADLILPAKLDLGDTRNMVYQGSLVTKGRGRGVVVSTGMNTQMGKIYGMLNEAEQGPTPLQQRLEKLGRFLVIICISLCVLISLMGVLRGEPAYNMFLAGVSLAVAAIPEGLPAIVTIALATGVQRLSRQEAIIRQLHAVETLGCTTIICSDKTGTLTQNEMTVQEIFLAGECFTVSGVGYKPVGDFYDSTLKKIRVDDFPDLLTLLEVATLCNNSQLRKCEMPQPGLLRNAGKKPSIGWEIKGDPTEGALLVAAAKGGVWRENLEKKYGSRLDEVPFSSERRMMSVLYSENNKITLFVKGAPEAILERCSACLCGNYRLPLTDDLKNKFLEQNISMATRTLRVLGVAFKEMAGNEQYAKKITKIKPELIERDLVFVGLIGLKDPPRPSAERAIETCKKAGIKVAMVTGDHPLTALAVGKEIGLITSDRDIVLTGQEMDNLKESELAKLLYRVKIFARVSPAHKLRIVRAYKRAGEIVAMTGDGVNDAPALKEADVGIAMGKTGTDVTKEASAMVLANDEFNTIVGAIKEGRGIYENIRKSIRYLLACNMGEVLTMFFSILIDYPLPLLPIQILWVNLVTDGLPAIALSLDAPDSDIMEQPPRPPGEGVFARGLAKKISLWGFLIGLSSILVYVFIFFLSGELNRARTAAFCCLVLAQLLHVFDCRSERWYLSLFDIRRFNPFIVGSVGCSILMQLVVVYHPVCQRIFHTVSLSIAEWITIVLAASCKTVGVGIVRLFCSVFKRCVAIKHTPAT